LDDARVSEQGFLKGDAPVPPLATRLNFDSPSLFQQSPQRATFTADIFVFLPS
jgi:hypothetical protein